MVCWIDTNVLIINSLISILVPLFLYFFVLRKNIKQKFPSIFISIALFFILIYTTSEIWPVFYCSRLILNDEAKTYTYDCPTINSFIPESKCPSGSGSASHIQDDASEIECSIHKSLSFDDKMFSFFKDYYLSLIDDSELDVSYSDCIGGITDADCRGTSIYNCILTNEDVIHIVYDEPAPCMQYNVFILPKRLPLDSAIKAEYVSSIKDGIFSTEIPCDIERCEISREITIYESGDKIILKEYHLTCP